ncbi:hypothetical protein [Azospirillum sp. Sh1]|uniref:hypothetical protein n=1 Tax=Azospirillum sp. Sh1 TaxID=2607285 RepID=UPI0011EEE887|nr:hypothetical protein [Azospirillum sp. Sh1]KAA0573404.1 hypothetical protein FZ029_20720 [Azospirillum sp. Sh1]
MSQLYTITIRRVRLRYLADGTLVEESVTQTISGLPPALVETWRRDFPQAFVSAIAEDAHYDKRRPGQYCSTGGRPGIAERRAQATRKPSPAPAGIDLGSLINQQLQE